jgi:hypothetical protein
MGAETAATVTIAERLRAPADIALTALGAEVLGG